MDKVKEFIASLVNESTGLKATELVSECYATYPNPNDLQDSDLLKIINELVDEGCILEVEYVVPQYEYRTKSFYLPIGTELRVVECQKKNEV